MEFFSSSLTLLLTLLLIFTFYWYYKKPQNLPPGPLGLPFIGSLPILGRKPYKTFITYAKRYGNIFHIYMGSTLVIILNDFEAIKEAFIKQSEVFSGRIDEPHRNCYNDSNLGVVHTDGEYWRQHRRFLISNLRSNGVGKHALEPRIMNEIHCFISEIQKTCDQPLHIHNLLNKSLLNNVLLLTNNTRYNYDDGKLNKLLDSMGNYRRVAKSVVIGTFFPWLSKIPALDSLTKTKEIAHEYCAIIEAVEKLIITKDDNEDDETTYVKAFMAEKNRLLKESKDDSIFSDIGLVHISRDLIVAGSETSATLLSWIMIYLTKYPKVQLAAQEEIDKSIGRDREATYDDRLLTPYTEAVIMETQRMVSLIPLSQPHRNIRQTTLFGYTIPASTMIIPNIYAVHYDPKLWGDPKNFRPERFIDENGQLLKPEFLIPFSLGKRACAGEPLARMELYLYFVTLLQNFRLIPTKTYQSIKAIDSIVRLPVCDLICFEKR